jgi:hypothetical protein
MSARDKVAKAVMYPRAEGQVRRPIDGGDVEREVMAPPGVGTR